MRTLTLAVALTTLGLFATNDAQSQSGVTWKGGGGWGHGAPYGRMYDTKTVVTLRGEVVSLERITPMNGMSHGIHAVLKTGKDTIAVHLGPAWYIENQDVTVGPKDTIEVKGSRIVFEGKPAIIAAQITKGDESLVLRDANGFPIWSGWRRR